MSEANAGRIYSVVSTYVVALLVLLVAGLCAVAPQGVRLFTAPGYFRAAAVVPWIAIGVMFQGLYIGDRSGWSSPSGRGSIRSQRASGPRRVWSRCPC